MSKECPIRNDEFYSNHSEVGWVKHASEWKTSDED
jgi:hypothetical protein